MNEERSRLARLLEAGARAFDEPTVRYVEALLARADGIEERVLSRVRARLDRLEEEMQAARKEAERLLEDLERIDGESAEEMRGFVASGDFREALRFGRSCLKSHDPEASARILARIEAIERRAEQRGVRFSPELRERVASLKAAAPLGRSGIRAGRWLVMELSFALLDGILQRSRGATVGLRLTRSTEELEQLGPYHPRAVATRALDKLGALAPSYLQALLAFLDDAAALDRLLPQPQPASKPQRKRK